MEDTRRPGYRGSDDSLALVSTEEADGVVERSEDPGLGCGIEYDIEISHGEERMMQGKRRVQAHVAPVTNSRDVLQVLETLQIAPRWGQVSSWSLAYRILNDSDDGPGLVEDEDETKRDIEETKRDIEESSSDGNVLGIGDKLLHLLQRWDIYNVLVVVSIWEGGCSVMTKGSIGARYKIILECAKAGLEQCLFDSIGVGSYLANRSKSILEQFRSNVVGECSLNDIASSIQSQILSGGAFVEKSTSVQNSLSQGQNSQLMKTRSQSAPNSRLASRTRTPPREPVKLPPCNINPQNFPDQAHAARAYGLHRNGQVAKSHFLHGIANNSVSSRRTRHQNGTVYLEVESEPPEFTAQDLNRLKTMNSPHPNVNLVFGCVAMLLGEEDMDWFSVRTLIRSPNFSARLKKFRITMDAAERLEKWIEKNIPTLEERSDIVKTSPLAGLAMDWLLAVADCTLRTRKRIPNLSHTHLKLGTQSTTIRSALNSRSGLTPRSSRAKSETPRSSRAQFKG